MKVVQNSAHFLARTLGVLFLAASPLFSLSARAIEQPRYTVTEAHRVGGKTVEIREYAPYLVAETLVETQDFDTASSEGFKRLAAFIFGENNGNVEMDMTAPVETGRPEKMDMTSPVSTEKQADGWNVRFVMPSKYTLETLPRPNDARITIAELPARTVAVISFSGFWSESNFEEHTQLLERFLASQGRTTVSEPTLARYNMPLTPWFLRTNEIQIEISE